MIYEVVMIVCLNQPLCTTPQEIALGRFETPPSIYQCFHEPLTSIATWFSLHPDFYFIKLYCGPEKENI